MAEMAGMSEDYVGATRYATIRPVFNMSTRHVMCSLGEPAV
jgi:hypothetical protein